MSNEQLLVSIGEMIDRKFEEKFEEVLDRKLDEVLDRKLDKRFEEFEHFTFPPCIRLSAA